VTHVAFDLGLKTTGFAWPEGSDHYTCPAHYHRSPITPQIEHDRYRWWRDTFTVLIAEHAGWPVWVEAPFLHPKHPSGSMGLLLLHGILRAVAIDHGSDVHTVTPAELKRWATGRGNASKDDMLTAATEKGWDGWDHNEADAWLLWRMALEEVAK
jgi:Holliday junction resolvasome RuvABC endonuclease subunit